MFVWREMSKHYHCKRLASDLSFSKSLFKKKTATLDLKHEQQKPFQDDRACQKVSLFKTTSCAASANPQAKESYQQWRKEAL